MDKPKAGVRTTEFWVTITPAIAAMVEMTKGDPETSRLLIMCSTVLGCFYIISRCFIKR